jgi:uncharacterized OsmC-like protein
MKRAVTWRPIMKTETILSSLKLWKEQPEKAQVQSAITARMEGSRAVIETGPFVWYADLPSSLGGSNEAPSPTALLLGALAGCACVFIRDTLGPLLGVEITDVRAKVTARADFRGLLGLDGALPDLADFALDIEVSSPQSERDVRGVIQAWTERCPVYLALLKPVKVATTVAMRPA